MKATYLIILSFLLFSCQNQEKIEKAKQASIDSMKVAIEKQKLIDSMNTALAKAEAEKQAALERKTVVVHQNAPTSAATAEERKRKGMSGAAKGALIGAGVGAITGAVVSKEKKGQGAIIGGLAGAGVGAGTGAIIDNEKKKKEEKK